MNIDDTSRQRAEAIVQGFVDGSASADDKYAIAIEYLNALDCGQGGYMAEIATLMQELLGRCYEAEEALVAKRRKPARVKETPEEALRRERHRAGLNTQQRNDALYWANQRAAAGLPSSAIDDKE